MTTRSRGIRTRVLAGAIIAVALLLLAEAVTRVATYAAFLHDLHRVTRTAQRLAASRDAPTWDVSLLFAPAGTRWAPIPAGDAPPAWARWADFPRSAFPKPPAVDAPAPGTLRIACLGDSTTWGGYPGPLQALVDRRYGPGRVEVANLGAQAADLPAVTLLANRFLPAWHPDLAVVYLGRNDLLFAVARARAQRAQEIGLPVTTRLAFRIPPASRGLLDLLSSRLADPLSSPTDRAAVDAIVQARLAADLDALLDSLQALGIRPVLSTLAAPSGDPAEVRAVHDHEIRHLWPALGSLDEYLARVDAFNAIVRQAASRRGLPLLDTASALSPLPGMFADICHLDGDGVTRHADIVFRALLPTLDGLLQEPLAPLAP